MSARAQLSLPRPASGLRSSLRAALFGTVALALAATACATRRSPATSTEEDADAPEPQPWLKRRVLPTVLARRGPAPRTAELEVPPGMELVRYPSPTREGELSLRAVVAAPRLAPETPRTLSERRPALLLLHSGLGLKDEHLAWAGPFVEAGFVVMLPSWRGENGNEGAFELLAGEVDDARAAGRWLASQPDVDVDRLFVFGHAEGGALAALLALEPDLPFVRIGASSGVTTAATFARWQREDPAIVPFDVANPFEVKRRALLPNAHELAQPLLLYVGEDDALGRRDARAVQERAPVPVEIVTVAGDATSSVTPALARFLERAVSDAGPAPGAAPVAAPVAVPVAATWRPAASSRSAP